MRRLLVISAAALVLLVGTVAAVSAQTPGNQGAGCGGWAASGVNGSYDYTGNATFKSVAEKLGLSTADLAKELQAGKSIAELANAKQVSLDEIVKIMDAPRDEMMQIMAKYGYMTQEQLNAMDQQMESWQKSALEEKGYFGGMGPGMMRGGMMGGFGGPRGMMGGATGPGGMMGGAGRGMMGGFGPRFGS